MYDIKRLIGHRYNDQTVRHDKKLLPFKLGDAGGGKIEIVIDVKGEEQKFASEEISAMILRKMKETAEGKIK